MSEGLGIVQYYVFKRPKNKIGRIVYGAELGATTTELGVMHQGETLLMNNGVTVDTPTDSAAADVRNKTTITGSIWEPVIGQPWLLHSIHFGVSEALKSAKPLIISLGEDNVKICKLLDHKIDVSMA